MADALPANALVADNGPAVSLPSPPLTGPEAWKPIFRQIGLVIGMAAVLAVGVVTYLWGSEPGYRPIFGALSQAESGEVSKALQTMGVKFKIDDATGAVMVPGAQLNEIRMKLASSGLPRSDSNGLEMLQQSQSLGTSQFMETARYNHALEEELANSIASIESVKGARVHLAITKNSVFLRERTKPSASVLLDLYPGRALNQGQVNAIVHLVASSIPQLEASQVTVVDQSGRLLSNAEEDKYGFELTGKQFEYQQRVEESYARRVEALLEPMIGVGKVKARVHAKLDFAQLESTSESYEPEKSAVRSEQLQEQGNGGGLAGAGVPGSLTNQPPGNGVIGQGGNTASASTTSGNVNKSQTRNYEVAKTISHTRTPMGKIDRLSVAVVVDQKDIISKAGEGEEAKVDRKPLTADELAQMTTLVKDAVGFDEKRGDSVNVINASFQQEAEIKMPEVPIWKQPWALDMGKQLLSVIVVLILVFNFLRPMLYGLFGRATILPVVPKDATAPASGAAAGAAATTKSKKAAEAPPPELPKVERARLPSKEEREAEAEAEAEALMSIADNKSYDAQLRMAQKLAQEDPALVTNVVRGWLSDES
jgi:flagellar M-ring protein FliF